MKAVLFALATLILSPVPATAGPYDQAASAPFDMIVIGDFTVKVTPDGDAKADIATLKLDKNFTGGMSGTSKGVMLGMQTATKGSAGYVAMERFTGSLNGKPGSFALQHSGTMADGKTALDIRIVPGSGTGALSGITGRMEILIENGKHHYRLHYRLPG